MSYDLGLCDPVQPILEDEDGYTEHNWLVLDDSHHMRGGTYAIGGEVRAKLNVTYNYSPHLYRVVVVPAKRAGDGPAEHSDRPTTGIRALYGLTGAESVPVLQAFDRECARRPIRDDAGAVRR